MRIRRMLPLLPLMGALVCAHASAARDEAIYRALAESDIDRADALSAQWLTENTDRHAFEVRIDVLTQRGELSKAPGDALRASIQTSDPALLELFDIERQMEKGEKAAASDAALQLLHNVPPQSNAAAELEGVIGCIGMPALGTDAVLHHLEAAKAIWHAQHSVSGAYGEYGVLLCEGRTNARVGRESAAIDALTAAAQLAAATFGDDVALRLSADYQVASELEQLGRVREELELREDTLRRARRHYGNHHVQTAEAEAGVGACLQQIGDYGPAREHYEAAEKILVDAPARGTNLRLRVLVNFANVLQEMGDEDAALQRYAAAYAMIAEKPGAERTRAIILTNTGNTQFRLAHYAQAEENYRQALALREIADGKTSPGLAFSLEGLGSAALMQRRYQASLDYFTRALAVRESVAQKDHTQHVQMISLGFGIAMAKWGLGDIDGASATAQIAADRAYTVIDGIAANLPERHRLGLREQLPPATALVVTLAAQRGDRASLETAWRLVMRERGLIARGEAKRLAEARAQTDPNLRAAWQTWRDASAAVAQSWLRSDADETQLRTLREQAERAEREFWDRAGNGPLDAVPSPDALAAALPDDAVLVAIAEGIAPDPAWPLIAGRTTLPDRWYAFRLDGKKNLSLVELGHIEAISAQTRAWYAALGNPRSDVAEVDRRGAALEKAVFEPLHVFDKPRRVFFVPEGELFRINPAALPVQGEYAVERGIQIHTLANESELLSPAAASITRVVLAGAPTFGGTTAATSRQLCQRAGQEGFRALPNASRELDSLQQLLAGEGRTVQMLTGDGATKRNVVAALPGAEAIHLATHGFSLDATCGSEPNSRSIVIASDERPSPEAQTMTLSGLAFTGASAAKRIDPSGILSAEEFASLDLSHAGWVVLSACDSGLGPIGRSEGVFGMRRAIRMAGARTVVMSLWEVDDASTADLMRALYRARFTDHADVPAAMAAAMKTTLAERRAAGVSAHPYYWAAFISEGGWR
jgi:CHAT domain-containing protein/tetratricopeptide (TPR) repeat protein